MLIIDIEIGQTNPLSVDATIINAPDCNLANGSVMIDVLGGSGNYNYSWSDDLSFDQSYAQMVWS